MAAFTRCGKGPTCEVHLLVESRRLMLPTNYGYCTKKARWWYESVVLCDGHKRALEAILRKEQRVIG